MQGKFFQIDRNVWRDVIKQGLNPGVVYLVLASGTGRDNRTTKWSINAVEAHTGLERKLARRALDQLIDKGFVIVANAGTRPTYRLASAIEIEQKQRPLLKRFDHVPECHWVWLPNTIVTGAGAECPPVDRIRRMQDVRLLGLFVQLYDSQDLAGNGGIHWRQVRQAYKRSEITDRGIWRLWGFDATTRSMWIDQPLADGFRTGKTDANGHDTGAASFWQAWDALIRQGLIECVPHLIEADSDEAMPIFACPAGNDDGTPEELELGQLARDAAAVLAPIFEGAHDIILAVPDNFPKVELVGVFRLRYRPHTANTASWVARTMSDCEWCERYLKVLKSAEPLAEVQHQGRSKNFKGHQLPQGC